MKQNLLISFVFSAFLSLNASSASKTLGEYWNETGLQLDAVQKSYLNKCYDNKTAFKACHFALAEISQYFKQPSTLIPTALVGDKDIVQGKLVKNYNNGLSLVLLEKPSDTETKTAYQISQQYKLIVQKTNASLEQLYYKKSKINFVDLFNDFKMQVEANSENNKLISYISAEALSAGSRQFDPHSHFDPKNKITDTTSNSDLKFYGVGVSIQFLNGKIVIDSLIEGGPLWKTGKIKKGDVLLKIDGIELKNATLESIQKKLRSDKKTNVQLQFEREKIKFDVTVLRDIVEVKNVQVKLINDFQFKAGYIRLSTFMDDKACSVIHKAILDLQAQNARGLILDLRSNPGGLLIQAQCIGGLFAGNNNIVGVKDLSRPNSEIEFMKALPLDSAGNPTDGIAEKVAKVPVVTLINAGSASASEVVSGALQDLKAAWVLGDRSFGKATVQAPREFQRSGFESFYIFTTVARFYQPSGRTNQAVGIQPDFEVPFKPSATEEERFSLREQDLFPNALPPEGVKWTQTRQTEVARIQACASQLSWAKKKYEKTNLLTESADYQLWSAEEILACSRN